MAQMITQLGMVFDISYPDAYEGVLRVISMVNLDVVSVSPFECLLPYSFYTSLVSHTVLPLAAVAGLLLARPALKRAGRQEASSRCVTAAFYVVFFIYPSVSAKQEGAAEPATHPSRAASHSHAAPLPGSSPPSTASSSTASSTDPTRGCVLTSRSTATPPRAVDGSLTLSS